MNSFVLARPVLSLVIPAYNYGAGLQANITVVITALRKQSLSFELIVVNDGSTDETAKIGAELADNYSELRMISYSPNRGKGYAVKQGVQAARGAYVFFTDVDLPYGMEPIWQGLELLRSQPIDMVLGSRDLAESSDISSYDLKRKIAKRGFNIIVNSLLNLGIKDTQCGLKGFKRAVALDIFDQVTRDDFSFDVEVLFLAKQKHYRFLLVPVHLNHSALSTVSVLRDSLKMFASVLVIANNHWHHRYHFEDIEPERS